jgi:hypothetical protein
MAETKRYQYVETKTWFVDIPADHTGNEPGQDELLIQYVIDEQDDRSDGIRVTLTTPTYSSYASRRSTTSL